MTEREYILAGNYELLDNLYHRLAEVQRVAAKRYEFILKQQHDINDLKKVTLKLYDTCAGEYPKDQWPDYYPQIIEAEELLKKLGVDLEDNL